MPSFQASHLRIPLIAVTLAVACSPGPADRVADTAAVAADTSRPAGWHDMAGMPMTGDADRDFLRMMSSHHRGLIELAHESMLKGGPGMPDPRTMRGFSMPGRTASWSRCSRPSRPSTAIPTQPVVSRDDQAIIDSLKLTTGEAYAAGSTARSSSTTGRESA